VVKTTKIAKTTETMKEMKTRTPWAASLAVTALTLAMPAAHAATISIDFIGLATTAMSTTESAGVIPVANWNSFFGISQPTPQSLINDSGATTGASVTWAVNGNHHWVPTTADTAGDSRMMRGYLDPSSTGTVTIANLPSLFTSTGYEVYVYFDGDNGANVRGANYEINSVVKSFTDLANSNFGGTFIEGTNYHRFTSLNASSFTLTATATTGGALRAPINGIQIVAVPEPSAALLGGLGLLALLRRRR
jgi:PEP-CTERM motif